MKILILCGGSGTRLFPLSRTNLPKQFAPLLPNDQTLFQKTLLRAKSLLALLGGGEICAITNQELYFLALEQSKQIGVEIHRFLLESQPCDTSAALICGALESKQGEILLVLPSDHLINNVEIFCQSVQEASVFAKEGFIATFGIHPNSPHTGYGYIHSQNYCVLGFYEKPSLDQAKKYLAEGHYFWNSGMFCFEREAFLQECQIYLPEILQACKVTLQNAQRENAFVWLKEMQNIPKRSIDYALMEKTQKIKMVESRFDWNDVGSFDSLQEEFSADANQNIASCKYYAKDSSHNFILAQKPIALIGVQHLNIIDTKDTLLITQKGRSQEVKTLLADIQADYPDLVHHSLITHRPWGSYEVLEEGPNYKIKKIIVKPQKRLSLQKHFHRNEHWIIVSGSACIQVGEEELFLQANQSTYIPMGTPHRLSNLGQLDLVMIEVQVGEYVGEDDILRLEDDYRRA